jgi:hypothetical protein
MVTTSKSHVFASAQSRAALPNKLSWFGVKLNCFGKTLKSIFPMISVVSNFENH